MASADSLWVASTSSPRRVTRIPRARISPCPPAISSRVELVPQSRAATAPASSAIPPIYHIRGDVQVQLLDHPATDRVVPPDQEPGQMGVQALHAPASPPPPPRRTGTEVPGGDGRVPHRRVAGVGL